MSLRRFVYLITEDTLLRSGRYLLRRIDMSRFFLPAKHRRDDDDPPPLVEARLPPPSMRFNAPVSGSRGPDLHFMLLDGGGTKSNMVVATGDEGLTVLIDPDLCSIRMLPALTTRKAGAVSVAVGDSLYVLDTLSCAPMERGQCFDGLIFKERRRKNDPDDDWVCRNLRIPPYLTAYRGPARGYLSAGHATACALVGGAGARGGHSIWVSEETLGTHAYDVATGQWSKAGDWALPFHGQARYVPEQDLWFGLAPDDDALVRAAYLAAGSPPTTPHDVWRDVAPAEWTGGRSSYLVHLGRSRFCFARLFTGRGSQGQYDEFVVFTGIEVERCGGGGELRVVKHRSRRYSLGAKHQVQRVL
ncbi:unnamed protein product [Urochloa decumbens]|uniref:Uncharacterized protein n=1 Tax=Urochloa decumbens TaxID=240449 RepID=A0ABC9E8K7_9POAL